MRHSPGVKAVCCLLLFFTAGLWADEAQDRAAINNVITALNDPAQRAKLFTRDADSAVDFERLIDLHREEFPSAAPGLPGCGPDLVIGMNEPWTAMTVPRVVGGTIQFITTDVATVDGASTVEGAITLARNVPLLFVMKKERTVWRISAVRILTARRIDPKTIRN